MAKEKVYPSKVLVDELHKRGCRTMCLWEIKGPKDTNIAWMTCYGVFTDTSVAPVIVQTYNDGDGWDVFTSLASNSVQKTVEDVMERTFGRRS